MRIRQSAIVLLSGGMDSTVLVHDLVKEQGCGPIYPIAFDYGQRHVRELECAKFQTESLNIEPLRIIDMKFVADLVAQGTSLVTGSQDVQDLDTLDESELSQPPTYVPNRNMILLSLAAAHAEAIGVQDVYYGAQAQDEYGYWDCTQAFLDQINAVLALNRNEAVTIHAPFVDLKKRELVTRGMKLGVDFFQTWSCYRGGEKPCGTCPTCVERSNAFSEAGITDPLIQ